jgi:hypothetical protein
MSRECGVLNIGFLIPGVGELAVFGAIAGAGLAVVQRFWRNFHGDVRHRLGAALGTIAVIVRPIVLFIVGVFVVRRCRSY